MNYLKEFLYFTTIEEGKENLKKAEALRDTMIGRGFRMQVEEDCQEIRNKLKLLENEIN